MDNIFNSLPIAITISILIVLFLIGLFIGLGFIMKKRALKMKKLLIIVIYLLYFILVAGSVFLIGWFFKAEFVGSSLEAISLWFQERIAGLIGAGITLIVASIVIKIARMILKNVSKSQPDNKRRQTITKISASVIKYTVWIIAFIIALAFIGINVTGAIAGLGIAGLVIGLGAQRLINDIISGFFIVFEHHYDVGDIVEIDGFKGTVIDIGLKTTKIKNWKNEVKIIANGEIASMVNFSLDKSLAVIEFGVSYNEDPNKIIDILNEGLKELMENDNILTLPIAEGIMAFEDNKIVLRVKCDTKTNENPAIERELRLKVKEILAKNNIEMPTQKINIQNANIE